MSIIHDTVEFSLHPVPDHEGVRFDVNVSTGAITTASPDTESQEHSNRWDAILAHSTANYNANALRRYADHGLVYADYYFLALGNKLLRMGLV